MTNLNDVMLAYEAKIAELKENLDGKWVLVCDDRFVAFDDLAYCAGYADRNCADKPYLIRMVGGDQTAMPISVFYHAVIAHEQAAPLVKAA